MYEWVEYYDLDGIRGSRRDINICPFSRSQSLGRVMIYYELLMMVLLCIIQDICNAPLSPQSNICNVQSLWAYWQDDEASLRLPTPRPKEKGVLEDGGSIGGSYLDHFLICSRYNARIKNGFRKNGTRS